MTNNGLFDKIMPVEDHIHFVKGENIMKKLLALLLALVMILSLAACDGNEEVEEDDDKKPAASGEKTEDDDKKADDDKKEAEEEKETTKPTEKEEEPEETTAPPEEDNSEIYEAADEFLDEFADLCDQMVEAYENGDNELLLELAEEVAAMEEEGVEIAEALEEIDPDAAEEFAENLMDISEEFQAAIEELETPSTNYDIYDEAEAYLETFADLCDQIVEAYEDGDTERMLELAEEVAAMEEEGVAIGEALAEVDPDAAIEFAEILMDISEEFQAALS